MIKQPSLVFAIVVIMILKAEIGLFSVCAYPVKAIKRAVLLITDILEPQSSYNNALDFSRIAPFYILLES